MEELAILTFIIRFSFIVSALNVIYWVYKGGKWLHSKMQVGELLWSPEELKKALDPTKDGKK